MRTLPLLLLAIVVSFCVASQAHAAVKSPLVVKPAKVGFKKQVLGTVGVTSPAKQVTLTNKGTAAIALADVAVDGDFALDPAGSTCTTSLAPGTQCILAVTFTPTALGTRLGTLTITHDAIGSPHIVALKGKGIAGKLLFLPAALKFPARNPGDPAVQTLIIRNPNPVPVPITGLAVSGDDFGIQTRTCASILPANGECTITIRFTPERAGSRKGKLRIGARAAKSPKTIALKGKGLKPDCGEGKTDLETDPANCGACGNVCPGTCSTGQCHDATMSCGAVTPDLCVCTSSTVCTSFASDPDNCGGCGNVCYVGQICQDGICTGCSGSSTPDQCGVTCTNLATDPRNCGGCGVECASGICVEGICSGCAATAPTACDGACTDVLSDAANCGGCGNVCPIGTACQDGACAGITCGPDTPDLCGARCTNVATDPDHCGGCNTSCGGGACVEGQCITCTGGTQRCGGACADLAIDDDDCGACGNRCPVGSSCSGGTCLGLVCDDVGARRRARTTEPPPGSRAIVCPDAAPTLCGNECVILQSDSFHCGACNSYCPSGQCVQGQCLDCKGATPDVCGTVCVDRFSDKHNCGGCGNVCASEETCMRGICQSASNCGGTVTNVNYDPKNCGTCGKNCDGNHCFQGTCFGPACYEPDRLYYKNCHGVCVDPHTDPNNCGDCDRVCAAAELCAYPVGANNGVCSICGPGRPDDCNGLCVDLRADRDHCGTCGHGCPIDQLCHNGVCDPCPGGATLCGDRCTTLKFDPNHCGACGTSCGGGHECRDGKCLACPDSAPVQCGGRCTDIKNDATRCGACWHLCKEGQKCIDGKCRGCVVDPEDPFCFAPCQPPTPDACGADKCVDFATDPKNCGGCGNTCPSGSCFQGACEPGACGTFRVSFWNGVITETTTDHCGGTANLELDDSVASTFTLTPSQTVEKGCNFSGTVTLTQDGDICGQWAGLWVCGGTVNGNGFMNATCTCLVNMSVTAQFSGMNAYSGNFAFSKTGPDPDDEPVTDNAFGTFGLERQ